MEVIFQSHPDVVIASNTFRNVPTILQFEDTPLLEVGQFVDAGYTTRFPVYLNDGTKIAVVVGTRIFATGDGKNANFTKREEPQLSVFELERVLNSRRDGAVQLGWQGSRTRAT